MIKIIVIAPYENIVDVIWKAIKKSEEYDEEDTQNKPTYEFEVITAYSSYEVKQLSINSDVLIARGYTLRDLREKNNDIPIVEIPLASSDILKCLNECKENFGEQKFGFICPFNQSYKIERISEIYGIDVKTFYINNSNKDVSFDYERELVENIARENINVVVGGMTTCKYASKKGIKTVLIKSSLDSMLQAIIEAKRVALSSIYEQKKALRFKTILNYAYEGIIAIDENNLVTLFNSVAEKILNVSEREVIGKNIKDTGINTRLEKIILSKSEYLDEIVVLSNLHLAVNKVNVMRKNEFAGKILTFECITDIQEKEKRIRGKIFFKGHIAKYKFKDIIGDSNAINITINTAIKFSLVDSNITIIGETGTGKELFAQSIHNYSIRQNGPFVAINCAEISENLLESELFGYVEGAFTGAKKGGKIGLFELAHKGTIFLDEISEISINLQSRLLRVIQEKEIRRLGDDKIIPLDVRIIVASNKNLNELVEQNKFRKDLYYRLDVLTIFLPSLAERDEDIILLAKYFIKDYGEVFNKKDIRFTEDSKRILLDYKWPGNIRQLKNICERLIVLSENMIIDRKDIFSVLPELLSYKEKQIIKMKNSNDDLLLEDIEEIERKRIIKILKETNNNKVEASKLLGMSRTTLWRKIKQFQI